MDRTDPRRSDSTCGVVGSLERGEGKWLNLSSYVYFSEDGMKGFRINLEETIWTRNMLLMASAVFTIAIDSATESSPGSPSYADR